MNEKIEEFHNRLLSVVLNAKSKEDNEGLETILFERVQWINTYGGKEKDDIIKSLLEKDKILISVIEEKSASIRAKILEEDQQNRNRGSYKLYE